MSEESATADDALDTGTGSGTLYVVLGLVAIAIAWFLFAFAGVVTIYCGYKLYADYDRTIVGGLYAAFGTVVAAIWVGYLVSFL